MLMISSSKSFDKIWYSDLLTNLYRIYFSFRYQIYIFFSKYFFQRSNELFNKVWQNGLLVHLRDMSF